MKKIGVFLMRNHNLSSETSSVSSHITSNRVTSNHITGNHTSYSGRPSVVAFSLVMLLAVLLFSISSVALGEDPSKRGTRGDNKGYQVTYFSAAPYVTSIQKGDVLGLGVKLTFTPVSTKYGRLFIGSRLDSTPYVDYGQPSAVDRSPFSVNLVNTGASLDFGYITASKFLNIWVGAGPSYHNLDIRSFSANGASCDVNVSGYYEGFNKFVGLELFASERSPISFFYEYRHDNVIQQQTYALSGSGCGSKTLLLDNLLGTTIKYHTFGIGIELR